MAAYKYLIDTNAPTTATSPLGLLLGRGIHLPREYKISSIENIADTR